MMGDLWQDIQNVAKAAVPFVGGGLSFLGGLLTNSANADIARANRHFIRNMYKKRYQFTVDDMRKAGLNPILAANGGSVGSVPSVSTPTMGNALEAGVSGALSTARAVSDIHSQSVSNAKTEADQKLAEANTNNVNARTDWQTIQNGILNQSEKALVEDAQARATNNRALATLNSARAEYAGSLAAEEHAQSRLRSEDMVQGIRKKGYENNILSNSPEYTMSADERRWLERAKVATGAANSAASSVLSGAKAFRYLK